MTDHRQRPHHGDKWRTAVVGLGEIFRGKWRDSGPVSCPLAGLLLSAAGFD